MREAGQPEPGKASPQAGRAAVEALRTATQDLKEGTLDAIVTAPFNKESVQGDDFSYTGHTEFFGAELGGEPMMILCSDVLRVGLVTKHIPVSEISRSISRRRSCTTSIRCAARSSRISASSSRASP